MLPPCRSWVDNLGVGLLPWIASASLPLFGSYGCVCVCVCVCVWGLCVGVDGHGVCYDFGNPA